MPLTNEYRQTNIVNFIEDIINIIYLSLFQVRFLNDFEYNINGLETPSRVR